MTTHAAAILRTALSNTVAPAAPGARTVTRRVRPQDERPANDPQYAPAANDPAQAPDPSLHVKLVHRLARRLARGLPPSVLHEDLVSAGLEGLVSAARRFDPTRGQQFVKFAEFRIKGAMLDEIRRHDMMSRGGRLLKKSLERAVVRLTASLGRPPTDEELADSLGVDLCVLQDARSRFGDVRVVSLQSSSAAGKMAFDPADQAPTPEAVAMRIALYEQAADAVARLEDRERLVIELYFREGKKLKEIAARIGTTDSRVCQIKRAALTKLRGMLAS